MEMEPIIILNPDTTHTHRDCQHRHREKKRRRKYRVYRHIGKERKANSKQQTACRRGTERQAIVICHSVSSLCMKYIIYIDIPLRRQDKDSVTYFIIKSKKKMRMDVQKAYAKCG
jgi:hypothetical protein